MSKQAHSQSSQVIAKSAAALVVPEAPVVKPGLRLTPCAGSPATVISIQPEHVHLSVQAAAACNECLKGRGCGLGLKAAADGRVSFALADLQILSPQRDVLPVDACEKLKPGSSVLLLLPQPQLLSYVIHALLIPALVVIFGVWGGHSIALVSGYATDTGAFAGVLAGIFCGLILARKQSRKLERSMKASHHAQLVLEEP